MDLNIENYSINDLLDIFNISEKNTNNETLQKHLSKSIAIITNQDNSSLPESKDNLIEFYTKSAFKILNSKTIINNSIKNKQEQEKIIEKPIEILPNELSINNNLINDNRLIMNRHLIPGGVKQPIPEMQSINTNNNKFVEGLVNPLERETITSLLTINSKFRNNYSKSSTDFSVELNDPYNNVVSIKLASMELINSYYTISQYLRTNRFNVEFFQYDQITNDISSNSIFTQDFIIPDGNYNVISMIDTLNEIVFLNDDPYSPSILYYRLIHAIYDDIKGKINFSLFDASGNPPATGFNWGFNLNFADNIIVNRPAFLNFGWLLGYRDLYYSFFKKPFPNPTPCDEDYYDYKYKSACVDGYLPYYQHTSNNILNIGFNPQAITNLIGTHYFLLEVDDFNKNQSEVFRSNTELKDNNKSTFNYSVFNVLARIPNSSDHFSVIFEDSSDRVFKNRRYFGPVRLSRLKIRLLDENGVVVNLNNNDIIINLEIETLNSPYKNPIYKN
jgi:hypothetical protein